MVEGAIIREAAKGPLAGVVVIDMSVVVAGPVASAMMAEMGAEVIKVECQGLPDSARGLGQYPVRGMASMVQATAKGTRRTTTPPAFYLTLRV